MIISDKMYIDLDQEKVSPDIFSVVTYQNPEYYAKMNMGLSVWKTPKTICTAEIDGRTLKIMRGEAIKVKPYLSHLRYDFDHPDWPINLQYINNDFPLDEFQLNTLDAIDRKRQGIIHAVTSAGKSLIIINAIVRRKQRALIVVHRKLLMQQLIEDIDKYVRDADGNKIKIGKIANGQCTIGDITIGIDKSVSKRIADLHESFGMVILDECHIAPAQTIHILLNSLNSKYRFGFSGTLKRKDQKDFLIYSTFGEVIATISKEQLLDKDRIVPVEVLIWESETKFDWNAAVEGLATEGRKNPTQGARHLQEKTIMLDPERNAMIVDKVAKLPGKTLVISRYVDPCYRLSEALEERHGIKAGIITGKDADGAKSAYEGMKFGELRVIFATLGCVSTGVSIPTLDNIVLISPIMRNELLLHQIRGRLMRKADGKDHGTLYYVFDSNIFTERNLQDFKRIMER